MIATATPAIDDAPAIGDDDVPARRFTATPAVEALVFAITIAVAATSWLLLSRANDPQRLIAPPFVALLLIANLVPGILVLMLIGRRIARRRAASSPVGGEGRLHVRLVAIFSTVAAVPMLLVTIAASLLFQYGVQFWYSDRARGVFENATQLTNTSYQMILKRWEDATVTMADDLAYELQEQAIDSAQFKGYFARQVYYRSLSEAALFTVGGNGEIRTLAIVDPYEVDFGQQITRPALDRLRGGKVSEVVVTGDRIQSYTRLPGADGVFLYAARVSVNPGEMTAQTDRARAAQADYRALLVRARSLQIRFNAALLIVSLLIVGVAVWIALAVADRLVRPVGELVDAARRIAAGDLSARVARPRSRDEVGTLANAFNRMTEQLQAQTGALVAANDQLDSRRALIEAVMAGVSAGVIATGPDRIVSIANASAGRLLGASADGVVGRRLADVAPELDALVVGNVREAVVQVATGTGTRTLAVRHAAIDRGPILTFDDVTQQLSDQRRAAWSDVARRIAHEIKNPLTPIQLAAERLQRRYGSRIEADDGTFARLTETIVRQVGDLRRMVDEFSSFARMPKPVFRREPLADTAREVMFLHEVAHPAIAFRLVHSDPAPSLVCDRRQIGQALTNIVKNAVEAIETKAPGAGTAPDEVVLTLSEPQAGEVVVTVADTGVGLPEARERIVEPYMTTRVRGTGLGLAIVKKIVEEHGGTIAFGDRPGGGTVVTMRFDAARLAALDDGGDATDDGTGLAGEGQLDILSHNRT